MITTHSSFPQPTDPSLSVWRYMTLAKLVAFLTDAALYFARSDLLGDPHEGTIPLRNADNVSTQFCDPIRPDVIVKVRKMSKLFSYVSCWHLSESESEAMWRIYCAPQDGIAIRTTYAKLARSVSDPDVYVGLVRYLDYRSQFMPLDNLFNPLMHKRKAFEHEREVRAVMILPSKIESVERDFDELKSRDENPRGINAKIDIAQTIDAIYVNPYAPKWYYDAVRAVLTKFSIDTQLEWSQIADEPHH